jgi:HEAT repeat protein
VSAVPCGGVRLNKHGDAHPALACCRRTGRRLWAVMWHHLALLFPALVPIAWPLQGSSLADLQRKLRDPKPEQRRAAAEAIARLGAEALPAAAALATALADKDPSVGEAAGHALGAIGKGAVPTIRKALADHERELHAFTAAGALGANGAELVPDMLKALRREAAIGFEQVTKAAVAIGEPAVPHLIKALKDRALSSHAVNTLAGMGRAARAAMPDVMQLAEDKSQLVGVRGSAASAVGSIGMEAAAPYVGRLLALARADKEQSVRINSLRTLLAVGVTDPADKDTLAAIANDPDASVAKAARDLMNAKPKKK